MVVNDSGNGDDDDDDDDDDNKINDIVTPQAFAERMGLETGWNCHISLREGSGHLMEDHGSSATVSERNPESLFDTQDDIYVAGQDGDEKHVSWRGVQSDDSPEKGNSSFLIAPRDVCFQKISIPPSWMFFFSLKPTIPLEISV